MQNGTEPYKQVETFQNFLPSFFSYLQVYRDCAKFKNQIKKISILLIQERKMTLSHLSEKYGMFSHLFMCSAVSFWNIFVGLLKYN